MKIFFLFLITLLFLVNPLLSNPIVSPSARISELEFKENNEWILEIQMLYSSQEDKSNIDSICIETSNGFSRIRLGDIVNSSDFLIVTSDSLLNPLSINREGDYILLYSFLNFSTHPDISSLHFGNFQGSSIDSPPNGYSIVNLYGEMYCKDRNPTIGLPNDTTGTCGMLKGRIYDKNNKIVTCGTFHLHNYFSILDDSTYLTNVYSIKVAVNRIYFAAQSLPAYLEIDTIVLNVNPGVLYEKDIHILEYFTDVSENNSKPYNNITIVNYPNPFNSRTNFVVTIPSSQKYKQKQINIYNTLGQKINSMSLTNQSAVQWDGKDFGGNDAATGTYFYQLILDNRVCKSGTMILLK